MAELTYKQNQVQRLLQHLPASAPGAAILAKWMHHADRYLMRFSNDRLSLPGLLIGLPVIMVTTTGAKSGQVRVLPLVGIPVGQDIVLVASNWGQAQNPAWYYNLRANPETQVEFGGEQGTYIAREVTDPEEYRRLWHWAVDAYLGYAKYRERAGNRKIPILLLSPARGA